MFLKTLFFLKKKWLVVINKIYKQSFKREKNYITYLQDCHCITQKRYDIQIIQKDHQTLQQTKIQMKITTKNITYLESI